MQKLIGTFLLFNKLYTYIYIQRRSENRSVLTKYFVKLIEFVCRVQQNTAKLKRINNLIILRCFQFDGFKLITKISLVA